VLEVEKTIGAVDAISQRPSARSLSKILNSVGMNFKTLDWLGPVTSSQDRY